MHIICLHSTGGDPSEAFFPWLKTELEDRGHQVSLPAFPNSIEPDPEVVVPLVLDAYDPTQQTLFVGRSSGGTILPHVLQQDGVQVELALSLAAPVNDLGWANLKKLFAAEPDWEAAKASVKHYHHWYSDDDPHVPLSHGEDLQKKLGGELRVFHQYSHFYNEQFPELVELIEKTVASSA